MRESEITDIQEKQGRSGALLFVTVRHRYRQAAAVAVEEEQDIVYREPSAPRLSLDRPMPDPDWSETITPDPTLLFRYSAVTFNSHRIHYDWPYVTDAEGYPGLVVHGPLLATLMCGLAGHARADRPVAGFEFRGMRPVLDSETFTVCGKADGDDAIDVWVANGDGNFSMKGRVSLG